MDGPARQNLISPQGTAAAYMIYNYHDAAR
ncbi:MAG: hypothetical protein RL115_2174 [Bacteroidota bacterium]|jgi:hypothetical protein